MKVFEKIFQFYDRWDRFLTPPPVTQRSWRYMSAGMDGWKYKI